MRGTDENPLPVAGIQERMWLADRLEPESGLYNVPMAWRVRPRLRPEALADALAGVVERHEILRSRFVRRGGALGTVVDPPWRPEPRHEDLRALPETERDRRLAEALDRDARDRFDPEHGRLLRASLLDLTDDEQVFSLCVHHLIWDDASAEPFFADLDRLYRTAAESPAEFPATPHQERIAFIDRFERGLVYPGPPIYHNLARVVRLRREPDPGRLTAAVDAAFARHEALRTDLVETPGGVVQRVAEHRRGAVRRFETASGDPGPVLEWAREPFDLATGPLLRVGVQPTGDGGAFLCVAGHQAVLDRPSLDILLNELLNGPVTAGRFRDAWRGDAAGVAALAGPLRSGVEPLRLPQARPRAAVHAYEERSEAVELPAAERLARRAGVAVEAVLLAAFAATLSRYSGQAEMVIGLPHDLRDEATRGVVGPLTNLLPLRLDVPVDTTFLDWVRDVDGALATARRHGSGPFEDVVRAVDPDKDMSRTALFDVLFQYAPEEPYAEPVDVVTGEGKYDLHLYLRPDRTGRLVYNGLYFDAEQVERMAAHLARLLAQAIADPSRPVGDLDPLTDAERRTQLHDWNDTAATYPDTTVHGLVREAAAVRPSAIAVTGPAGELTYRELTEGAETIARALAAHGVRPGEPVALMLERGPGQVQAMLGVLMAGAAYVPLAADAPPARAAHVIADSGARWVIASSGAVEAHARSVAGAARVLPLRDLLAPRDPAPLPSADPSATAYLLYTSGTTGSPKGVRISHRNVVRLLRNDRFPFAFGPDDVWTFFHSYTFDFSVWEVFGCLAYGGRLVVVGEDQARDAGEMWALLRREGVTVFDQTPGMFAEMLLQPAPAPDLRYVIFGGDTLRPAILADWARRHPDVRLVNMYGITETTVHVTVHTLTAADIDADAGVIGVPLPTTTVRLLDRRTGRHLLPVGAVGELYVGGDGVTPGYVGRPDLDAERLVPDPFGAGRLFRTGDLARYRPDGTLEFAGRADAQIKLRGHRVEPGEITAALRAHPAVAEAEVLLDADAGGRLVAFLRLTGDVTTEELRGHLAGHVPDYMIPARYLTVDRVPLTPNGKADREALWRIGEPLDTAAADPEVLSPTAQDLAEIWTDLLDPGPLTAHSSFFEVGGHSLLATRMLNAVAVRLGAELVLREVFDHPRLGELAAVIDAAAPPEDPVDGLAVPVSDVQRGLWLAERSGTGFFQIPLAWKVRGALDPDVLRRALASLVERHEILRTRFVETRGRLHALPAEPWEPEITTRDLRGLTPAERDRWVLEQMRREVRDPLDLTAGRPLRATLADAGTGEQVLVLCVHHLVCDGESVPALLRELDRCYEAARDGHRVDGDAPQYREFAAAEVRDGDGGVDFWAELLSGAPAHLAIAPPTMAEPHGSVPVPVPEDLLDRLRPVQREYGASWFAVLTAALAAVLHGFTGQDDLTIGCPVSSRTEDLADVIGPCLNTVALRSRLTGTMTLGELVDGMRDTVLDALAHHSVPLEAVVERLAPPRRPGRAPYLDVVVNAYPPPAADARLGGKPLDDLRPDALWHDSVKFGLTLTAVNESGRLRLVMSYRGDRIGRDAVTTIARELGGLLTDLPARLHQRVHAGRTAAPAGGEAVQYREFVAAERTARGTSDGGVGFWVERLSGAPAYLPAVPPRTAEPHGSVAVPLAGDLLDRLRPVQGEYGVSWFAVLATALAVVLHRFTGQDDLTIGCPVSSRPGDLAEVIGPCLNTVALRSRLTDATTLGGALSVMRETVLDALGHQSVPFETVVERLNPPRRPGRTPYLDVALITMTGAGADAGVGGSRFAPFTAGATPSGEMAKFALAAGFEVTAGRIQGTLSYRGDRFAAAEIRQLARLLGRVLDRFAGDLDRPVRTLGLLDAEERARLAALETGPAPLPPATVPALLARQRPDAQAVVTANGATLTFADLEARALGLAALLRPYATGTDPVIGVVLGRGADYVVAMLAAWYAGCAFCPVDPEYPPDRIDVMLRDVGARAVVSTAALDGFPYVDVRRAGPADGPPPIVDPAATAYVIYTSGTTGRPKGVPISHRSLAGFVQWGIGAFGLGPGDRVAQAVSVGFDVAQAEVWCALGAGAALVPYEAPLVPADFAAWLAEQRITVAMVVTPVAELIWSLGTEPPDLRLMVVAGSKLTSLPAKRPAYRICNGYGPTEATVLATAHMVDTEDPEPLSRIGRPVGGATVYVLDPDGGRCPVGVPGEICIGGTGVSPGYLGRPDLTARAFRATTPDGSPGPVYRTGDQGRWLHDGTLDYLGRRDRQVKVRGHRIEPAEIEAHLREDPAVAHCAVRAFPGESAELVAYAVPRTGEAADARAVLGRLRVRLPRFMVPDTVVWLDELPRSASDKVDASALPRPSRSDLVGDAVAAAPETERERRIGAVWCAVLGVESVGVHDNFFDLGGNSLLLGALHARLNEDLGVRLPIQRLFEHPTVRALAAALGDDPGPSQGAAIRDRAARGRVQRARQTRGRRETS